ncbi:hypothetical protein ADUPG1_006161 [Aduncisulcus paluster]|uniref:Macro domain-containing protein n=1 Tax=Aduncisulcus paluster TaxID=2918883 RepID=A0ABQ5KIU8_9EUKA|nr:hypothetical protein ADUPG1_006161 [Aduncisulcus paluster]
MAIVKMFGEERRDTLPAKTFDRVSMIKRIKEKMKHSHSKETLAQLESCNSIIVEGVQLVIFPGNICTLGVDAIVNAANIRLRGGGGVDGFIHRGAGAKELVGQMVEQYPRGCSYGECCMSESFKLPCASIFHTVGPMSKMNDPLLASCYTSCLDELHGLKMRSIAFPAISCGAYAYSEDVKRACEVAVTATIDWIKKTSDKTLKCVVFVCFDRSVKKAFEKKFYSLRKAFSNPR